MTATLLLMSSVAEVVTRRREILTAVDTSAQTLLLSRKVVASWSSLPATTITTMMWTMRPTNQANSHSAGLLAQEKKQQRVVQLSTD